MSKGRETRKVYNACAIFVGKPLGNCAIVIPSRIYE
jgi:hypothetical protein